MAQRRGATDLTSTSRVTTLASYDVDTGLVLSATDANGRTARITYLASTLRPQMVTWSTGATISYDYDDSALTSTETTRDWFGLIAEQTITWLNGLGLVRRQETLAEGGLLGHC
jgi:hypothetical protein